MIVRGAQLGVIVGYELFTRYYFLLLTPLSLALAIAEHGAGNAAYALLSGLASAAWFGVLCTSIACTLTAGAGALIGVVLHLGALRHSRVAAGVLGGLLCAALALPVGLMLWNKGALAAPLWYTLFVAVPAALFVVTGARLAAGILSEDGH